MSKADLSLLSEKGELYQLPPFVKAEHDGWPVHSQSRDSETGAFAPSGYRLPVGLSRHARRRLWRRVSNRRQRMEARVLRWPPVKLTPKGGSV